MAEQLFVYGTLHPQRAPAEIADVVKKLRPVGNGTIRGRLFNFGDYPGVILDTASKDRVHGTVFILPEDSDALARLDNYEEYDPNDPARSLFKRRKTKVTFADGSIRQCWIYVYNQPVPQKAA